MSISSNGLKISLTSEVSLFFVEMICWRQWGTEVSHYNCAIVNHDFISSSICFMKQDVPVLGASTFRTAIFFNDMFF